MSTSTKFSVCMSVYYKEHPEWLNEALNSVYTQTLPPTEVILVEDGPLTDDLYNVIANYPQLKIVKLDNNFGLGYALNEGLKHCSYDLVARMDTDDVCLPQRFEHQVKQFVQNPKLSVASGHIAEFIESKDNIIGERVVPIGDSNIKRYLKRRDPFNHVAVMFRKSDVIKAGGYLPWHFNEDSYLWIRMFMAGCYFDNLDEVLVNVRVGKEMYARRGGWKYFKSEHALQKLKLKNKIITPVDYIVNTSIHFIVKVLMPNKIRALLFQNILRKKNFKPY